MNTKLFFAAASLLAATAAQAATTYPILDRSTATALDAASVQAVWNAKLPSATAARLTKLYPVGRWSLLSQVEGGFNDAKICIITARVAMVPRAGKSVVFTPLHMSTAFDAQPNATQEECKALAKAKLGEAIDSVVSSLVAAK